MQIDSPPLLVSNPSLRLQSLQGHDFLFHHGHLLEDIYKFLTLLGKRVIDNKSLSELKAEPLRDKIEELERENWPWIDFIWSGFTRAGRVGPTMEDRAERVGDTKKNRAKRVGYTMEDIYELLSQPKGIKELVHRAADVLRTEFDIPIIPKRWEDDVFRCIINKALKKGGVGSEERADHEKKPYSDDLKKMTHHFMDHYMRQELKDEGLNPVTNGTRFIFGHTHKPFLERHENVGEGFGEIEIANTGGWVIESDEHLPNHGPGILFGCNNGDMALVKYELNIKSDLDKINQPDYWDRDNTLRELAEHEQLALAISEAVAVRWTYFKERIKETKKLLKKLSK
jgi:hypothetical protein